MDLWQFSCLFLCGKLKGQASYGLCWAASVATIVNYVFVSTNSNVTAKDACAKEGIGWNDGATILQKQQALFDYKIPYASLAYRQCTWSEVTSKRFCRFFKNILTMT